jgi:hypothetical protein
MRAQDFAKVPHKVTAVFPGSEATDTQPVCSRKDSDLVHRIPRWTSMQGLTKCVKMHGYVLFSLAYIPYSMRV